MVIILNSTGGAMLIAFLIMLGEGIEAAPIVGIVASYLSQTGRARMLPLVWSGVALASILCLALGVGLDLASAEFPQAQQELFEGVAAVVAAGVLTSMVLWMRKAARSIKAQLHDSIDTALRPGRSGLALLATVVLAVGREGLESVFFLLATFEQGAGPSVPAGAVLGLLGAVAVGYGIYRGGVRLDLRAFFRWTGLFIVFVSAGLLASAVRAFHGAGLWNGLQDTAFDLSAALPNDSVAGTLLTGLFGYNDTPTVGEVAAYLAYLLVAFALLAADRRRPAAPGRLAREAVASSHSFIQSRDPARFGGPGRRGLLLGLGAAGSALAARATTVPDDRPAVAEERDSTEERQPFYGRRQSGIVTPQPAAALVAAFDVLAENRAELQQLLRLLTERCAFLTQGGPVPPEDPRLPPLDSGVLGPRVFPDNLTVTASLGSTMFDGRFGLGDAKPRSLLQMEAFPNDALDAEFCHGDLLLQFNANTAETNIHALRDILKTMPEQVALRWKMEGFLPPHTVKKQGRDTVRNLMGFKDGTANLDTRNAALMDSNVWVQPGSDEPAWAVGGSYHAVRLIRMMVERWDRTPLQEQQTIFGRDKAEGAPLGMAREHDEPDYAADPAGARVPRDAHIRLANPRTEETRSSLILRRGCNYSRGLTKAGQLDMGLLFGCFQSDLRKGFLAVQERLNGEPLEEYVKPFGGGYFFALPGVRNPDDFFGSALLNG